MEDVVLVVVACEKGGGGGGLCLKKDCKAILDKFTLISFGPGMANWEFNYNNKTTREYLYSCKGCWWVDESYFVCLNLPAHIKVAQQNRSQTAEG